MLCTCDADVVLNTCTDFDWPMAIAVSRYGQLNRQP
jgi:hypothetical protein